MKMNINMKKIVFFLLVQFVAIGAFAQEAAIKEAEVAYTKEDYGKAIELYEGLLKTHGESAEIYYNLGNAYYKENKIAPAILNYERALLLDPGDGDIRFNLQLARQKSVDKNRWAISSSTVGSTRFKIWGLPIRGRRPVSFVLSFLSAA